MVGFTTTSMIQPQPHGSASSSEQATCRPARSIPGQLSMFDPPTCADSPNAISSPASADGPMPCGSPDGPTTGPSGPDHARVSRSRSRGSAKAPTTSATSGQSFDASSPSATLQRCLASRLQAVMAGAGSPLYALTWKDWDMPSGPPICALRGSARRISDSGSTGWPTPCQQDGPKGGPAQGIDRLPGAAAQAGRATPSSRDWKDTPGMAVTGTNPDGSERTRLDQLPRQAAMAGWPTVTATDAIKRGVVAPRSGMMGLSETAPLAGWPTPMAMVAAGGEYADPEKALARVLGPHANDLRDFAKISGPARYTASGAMLTGSTAAMESGGQLNPELPRWLMGFPAAWGCCGATAMRSLLRSQRRSSRPPKPREPMQTAGGE